MLNIPTFSGRKFYYPDLQINKGQLDRIINAAYYQVIIKDHITYPELYSFKKKKKSLVIVKEDISTYSIVIRPIFDYSYLGYSLTALQYAQFARLVKADHLTCS